jgi:hypothetical protein
MRVETPIKQEHEIIPETIQGHDFRVPLITWNGF